MMDQNSPKRQELMEEKKYPLCGYPLSYETTVIVGGKEYHELCYETEPVPPHLKNEDDDLPY